MSTADDMERDVRRYMGLRPYERSGLRGDKKFLHACVVIYGQPFSDWVEKLRRHLDDRKD